MSPNESKNTLNPKGIAKYLGFHEMTVYRFLREGKLPAQKVKGRWRSSTQELDAWMMKYSNGFARSANV